MSRCGIKFRSAKFIKNEIAKESSVNEVVKLERHDVIAVVTVNNPPVNALSAAVRGGIFECIKSAIADPEVKAIVLTCAGRTFIAGADITEFGKPPKPPGLHEVLTEMENSPKPIIAAIHGTALGGGLEVALACHFRVATKDARLGLPEVKLGLLPGAGGTQRLPRAVGPELAVKMIVGGDPIGAAEALIFFFQAEDGIRALYVTGVQTCALPI